VSLDVNTDAGLKTLADERRAAELFEKRFPGVRYIHTDKSTAAKADAVLIRDDQISRVVLTSCRYNCTRATLRGAWANEWLLTWRKLMLGAWLAKHLETRLTGFLYFADEDKLLVRQLYDPSIKKWAPFHTELTETQATVNGGRITRKNAFINMDKAIEV
jgi:hypothetical protein